ncbi:MAG: Lrp/AsnC family transcriptional regulator [Sphingomonadaceae bacterium]|nr:Lrp/AsnC family transcriptional regulator [Sphingomonadaceae bacterium]
MSQVQIDELDRQLIDILSKDARISNRKIAADLGVTEGTVRGRIRRLQNDRLIAFTAITSFELADNTKMAFIGVQADFGRVNEIADTIAKLPAIDAVMITMGRFNIQAFCLFSELDRLHEIASEEILSIDGVHHVESSIAVKTLKYNARIVKITDS